MHDIPEEKQPGRLSLKTWARLLPFLKQIRGHIAAVLVLMVVSAVAESTFPLFTRFAVNHFITAGTTAGLVPFALLFFAVIVFEGVTVMFFARRAIAVEMHLGRAIRRESFVHLQKLPVSFISTTSVGFLIARVMSDVDRICGMIAWGLSHLAWNMCYLLGIFIFMFTLNARLAALLLAVVPVLLLITWLYQKKLIVTNRRVRAVNAQITGAFNEGISGAKASKTLVIEARNIGEFNTITSKMYRASVKSALLTALMLPLITFCGSVAVGVVLYRGGVLVMDDLLDYGMLAAFVSYAVGMIEPVMQAAHVLSEMITAQVGIERVTALLGAPLGELDSPEVMAKYGDVFDPKRENWEALRGDIEFEDVWFRYPDSDTYVLEGFSLKIPAGTTVAIVGETGAGKSTLVNLACRFYEPTAGRILIDGRDYRERSLLWLHSSLGYVLQDPHLFSGTIMENIRYGRLDATDEDVVRAAGLVSADAVVARLPKGFDTEVGEGGDRLSTGEKQLISFARAILADPPIFVLDEATSSIDTETEQLIQNAITHIMKGRTTFIIAHRLSTIRKADLILVVDAGRIIERGTHEELLKKEGRYAALCRAMQLEEDRY
jgi:ATP-binding cassette subfamily B protein